MPTKNPQHRSEQRWKPILGAIPLADGRYQFRLWAPKLSSVQLVILNPEPRLIDMDAEADGYFRATIDLIFPGSRYCFRCNGQNLPDPVSRCQPEGVHGPSQIIALDFGWDDGNWRGLPLPDYIVYELHVGTFTDEGTFDAVISHLDALKELGITALELMPVAQFAGARNWGYDGVYPFAPQVSYGGADGLRRLVNACHQHGLAVVLDIVYNHFGPEGSYLGQFAPYFTEVYEGNWGTALNFAGDQSEGVRHYFIENALYWFEVFHIDALRLDATDQIIEFDGLQFFQELSAAVHQLSAASGRPLYLIAENDHNDYRLTLPVEQDGYGLDAQWLYDFHHAIYPLLVPAAIHYYADFTEFKHLEALFRQGFVYTGQYSVRRGRNWGTNPDTMRPSQFVAYLQSHDRVGNRPYGERLSALASFETLKLAAVCTLLSPFVPLLFMGEEYAEAAPFLFFTDFSNAQVAENVCMGRQSDAVRRGFVLPQPLPDPQSETTFLRSKLDHALENQAQHGLLRAFYKHLIGLRKSLPSLHHFDKAAIAVAAYEQEQVLSIRRWQGEEQTVLLLNFSQREQRLSLDLPSSRWTQVLDSAGWLPNASHPLTISEITTPQTVARCSALLLVTIANSQA